MSLLGVVDIPVPFLQPPTIYALLLLTLFEEAWLVGESWGSELLMILILSASVPCSTSSFLPSLVSIIDACLDLVLTFSSFLFLSSIFLVLALVFFDGLI